MHTFIKSIVDAPRLLAVACLLPSFQLLVSLLNNPNPVLLLLLVVSLVCAYVALVGWRLSRPLVIIMLGAWLFLNVLFSYHAHFAFVGNVGLFEVSEWYSESARLLLWPFMIGLIFSALNVAALCYVVWSKNVKAFYQENSLS